MYTCTMATYTHYDGIYAHVLQKVQVCVHGGIPWLLRSQQRGLPRPGSSAVRRSTAA